jgi:hypothetical protein
MTILIKLISLVLLLSPYLQEEFMCSGDYPSFVLEIYESKDDPGYVANLKNEKITKWAMAAVNMSKENIDNNKHHENDIKINFEEQINKFMPGENYVIYQFKDKSHPFFTRYFPAVEEAIKNEDNLKIMAHFTGEVDVSKYVDFLYQQSSDEQKKEWKKFAKPDENDKITFATQAIWQNMGNSLLSDLLIYEINELWSFYHVLTFSKALISLTRSMHKNGLFLMNLNSYSIDFKDSTSYEGNELKDEFVDYSFFFGGKARSMKYFRFFDTRDSNQDYKENTFFYNFDPTDDTRKKNWAAWDVYSIALLLMDIELATLGYGTMTSILHHHSFNKFYLLDENNKYFFSTVFTDLKDQTEEIWKRIYPDNTDIDDISESTWDEKSKRVLRQYAIIAVVSYFHSDRYKKDLNEQVVDYTNDVFKEEDNNEKIMNFTAATINNFGATTKGPYITVLANVLLSDQDNRFSLDYFEESLDNATDEYKDSVKEMGDFLINLSGLGKNDDKEKVIGKYLVKRQTVENVAKYEEGIYSELVLPLDDLKYRRIILV